MGLMCQASLTITYLHFLVVVVSPPLFLWPLWVGERTTARENPEREDTTLVNINQYPHTSQSNKTSRPYPDHTIDHECKPLQAQPQVGSQVGLYVPIAPARLGRGGSFAHWARVTPEMALEGPLPG